jgi:hypothetical protein
VLNGPAGVPLERGGKALYDIDDVERYTAYLIRRSSHPYDEDLHAYLIEQTWKLSQRYDPNLSSQTFRAYAGATLAKRIIDYTRAQNGDHRYKIGRARQPTISIDHSRPDEPQPSTSWDPPRDRDADQLVRLLRARSSDEAWRHQEHDPTLP